MNIKIVLPVCKKEAPIVARLVHRFKQFNDMLHRDIVIVASWEDQFEAQELVKFVAPLFKTAQLAIIPDVPEFAEWPSVGNHVFYETAKWLHEGRNNEPWFFYEPDVFPFYPFWLDDFQHEYDEAGKPFCGAMNITRRVNLDTGETTEDGRHMVGTAIYPADFFEKSQALHMLTDSWDVEIQNELEGAVHETALLCHRWNTGNYHISNGELIGADFGPNKGRYGGTPIPKGTACLHGCKDASLTKIPQEIFDRFHG